MMISLYKYSPFLRVFRIPIFQHYILYSQNLLHHSFMASLTSHNNEISPNNIFIGIPIHTNGTTTTTEPNPIPSLSTIEENSSDDIGYSQRAQWLRAAVLGANDGLVSVASLMMGVGAAKEDIAAMLVAGFAGLVAGACSMAIGEFVSVYTQYDIEMAEIERKVTNEEEQEEGRNNDDDEERKKKEKEKLPSPFQAALASALAFSVGAVVPLLGAVFIRNHRVRLGVVATVASLALLVFGGVGAVLGRTSVRRSCIRVLIGGWAAMAITFGLTKLIGDTGI